MTVGKYKAIRAGSHLTFTIKDADQKLTFGVLGPINEETGANLLALEKYVKFFKTQMADAIVVTGDSGEQPKGIRDVLAGKTYLAPAAAAKLAEGVTRVQLTPRELSTLRLLADGKSNKEIANALGIAERTVKTHLGHLFEKLGVTSRTEAVKVATRRGLVRLG